ncbi:acyl-CoA desaturase [Aurantiacibacter sp. MUD61]|uniref:acyl-CoA desaturase n=1 Tax=Aurantiacibacter sp. MUD61 TaxID=3009083 RepID=UPI0022F0C695|nr:acyl-CoA desaturase [Aurantiacibacter sp. MUD61]
MMEPVIRVNGEQADCCTGRAVLDWSKVLWNGTMLAGTLAALFHVTLGAVVLFVALTYATLLIGHSVGMHRMMIHRSFKAKTWLRRLLIYVGTIVGVAGPFGIIRIHDTRDWAQRQPVCHDFFNHDRPLLQDLVWNLFYRFDFARAPIVTIEPELADDPLINWLDATWRFQQIPVALLLFWVGGWPFVLWGIFARVFVSTAGHWTITWFCHNPGPGRWHVTGAGVQASNLPGLGWLTYGECWHNNHHAFPESAKIGLEKGQTDPAWWLIERLQKAGWVFAVRLPREENERGDLFERSHHVEGKVFD